MNRPKEAWIKGKRLLHLSELLRGGEYSVKMLIAIFDHEATERDLQRDLEDLEEFFPKTFYRTTTRPPRYSIAKKESNLDPVQALAVHAATRLVYHRARGHSKPYRSALDLLSTRLPERVRGVVQRGTKDSDGRSSKESLALEKVASAWFEGHRLKFEYQAANGSGAWHSNELEVYFIEVHPTNLGLYAVGLETSWHKRCLTFKLSRMRHFNSLRDTHYTIPDSFDPQAFFRHAWGVTGQSDGESVTVKLRFAPEAVRRLEEGGYPNMTIKAEPDGSRLVTIRSGVDKTGLPLEVLAWVLTWGPRVEVLKPQALRERWLADCREVVARYGGGI
jgi:predicted DNA-binding transcriptional regulator YafY